MKVKRVIDRKEIEKVLASIIRGLSDVEIIAMYRDALAYREGRLNMLRYLESKAREIALKNREGKE